MSQNSSSVAEMPNDTYPSIRKMWMEDWEDEVKKFIKAKQREAKDDFVQCFFAAVFPFLFAAMFVWVRHWIWAAFFVAIMLLPLIFAIKFFKKSRSKDFRFREYPKSFSTFDWWGNIQNRVVIITINAILRITEGGNASDEERMAVMSIARSALAECKSGSWKSNQRQEIGMKAIRIAEILAELLPVSGAYQAEPSTGSEPQSGVSSSTMDFDPA